MTLYISSIIPGLLGFLYTLPPILNIKRRFYRNFA